MPCPSCPASLILRRPGCKLRLLLLKRRCKEPHIFIDRPDPLHFLSCQFKIKDIKIIPDMLRIGGFRENDRAFLNMQAQDDLNIGFPIFLRQLCKDRLTNQVHIKQFFSIQYRF